VNARRVVTVVLLAFFSFVSCGAGHKDNHHELLRKNIDYSIDKELNRQIFVKLQKNVKEHVYNPSSVDGMVGKPVLFLYKVPILVLIFR